VESRGLDAGGAEQASAASGVSISAEETMRFLRELRQLRTEAGLESAELAARAHYPHDVIVAAEAGPELPELPVLSAYVRGCGGGLTEWEERWRSVTGSPATSLHLPSRPAGSSSLAEAGAQAAYASPPVDPEDQRRILAAITRAATEAAAGAAAQQSAQSPGTADGLAGGTVDWAAELATPALIPPQADPADSVPEPVTAGQVLQAPGAAPFSRRAIAVRRAALPSGAGIAALVAAIMCIVGMILLLLR
jgi:hypothetical protein